MLDLHNNVHPVTLFAPAAAMTGTSAKVSAIIDTKGYNAAEFIIETGAITGTAATFAVLVEDGDAANLSDAAAVPDTALIGTEALAGFTYADDNKTFKIGYSGTKRYVRVTITPTGLGVDTAFVSGVAVLGRPGSAPTANPPA